MHRLCIALGGDLSESSRLFSVSATKVRFRSIFCLILHHHESINYFPCIHTRIVFLFVKNDLGEHYWNFSGSWEYPVIYFCISHEKETFKIPHGLNIVFLITAVVLSLSFFILSGVLSTHKLHSQGKSITARQSVCLLSEPIYLFRLHFILVIPVKTPVRRIKFRLSLLILPYIHRIQGRYKTQNADSIMFYHVTWKETNNYGRNKLRKTTWKLKRK